MYVYVYMSSSIRYNNFKIFQKYKRKRVKFGSVENAHNELLINVLLIAKLKRVHTCIKLRQT